MSSHFGYTPLFVWRDKELKDDDGLVLSGYFNFWGGNNNTCPFCNGTIVNLKVNDSLLQHIDEYPFVLAGESDYSRLCSLCGWNCHMKLRTPPILGGDVPFYFAKTLKHFDINSEEVLIEEIALYVKKYKNDIYAMNWRSFERLIIDVLKRHGYQCVLTQASKDGGADILMIGDQNRIVGIVECKKYSQERKVGIEFVRNIVGAAVDFDVRSAQLFTTSTFTKGAIDISKRYNKSGFKIDLVDIGKILNLLKVYNEELPVIEKMDKNVINEIQRANIEYLERRNK